MKKYRGRKRKIYIFVSHSHKDIKKVRKIRDYLESLGAEPILFFLKSKNDKDEITQLIKDEIDVRFWFIYCKSKFSEASTWCQMEVQHVDDTGKRQIEIDIDNCLNKKGELKEEIKNRLYAIYTGFREFEQIYLSYYHKDRLLVNEVKKFLKGYGIKTFDDTDLNVGLDWGSQIEDGIKKSDLCLFFCTTPTVTSEAIISEICYAVEHNRQMIVVLMYKDEEEHQTALNYAQSDYRLVRYHLFDSSTKQAFKKSIFRLFYELVNFYVEEKLQKYE